MSARAMIVVAVAAVLLVLLALYGHHRSAMGGGSNSGALLLPKLKAQLNDVDQVRIEKGGHKTIATLKRTSTGWTVAEKGGYPADIAKIRSALIALSEAKIIERETTDPKFYSRLGLEPIKLDSATGTAVTITGPDHPPPTIILGGTEGSQYRYARLENQAQSYLLDKNPDVPGDTTQWLDAAILNVPGKRVQDVTIRHTDGETLKISKTKPTDTNFTVADVPKGRGLLYPGVADVIGDSLRELKLQDVSRDDDGSAKPDVTAVFHTFDGLIVTAKGGKRDGKSWVTFAASIDPQRLPAAADKQAAKNSGDDKPAGKSATEAKTGSAPGKTAAGKLTAADIRAEAKTINAKVSGWRYQIPSYQYDQITRRMADLLKAQKKAKTAAH